MDADMDPIGRGKRRDTRGKHCDKTANKEKRKMPKSIPDETIILGQVPSKTTDLNKLTTYQDKVNYEALCRGDSILPDHVTKDLTCFYTTR